MMFSQARGFNNFHICINLIFLGEECCVGRLTPYKELLEQFLYCLKDILKYRYPY